MENNGRYQLHVRSRPHKAWDVRRARVQHNLSSGSHRSAPATVVAERTVVPSKLAVAEPIPQPIKHGRLTRHRSRGLFIRRLSLAASAVLLVGLTSFVGINIWLNGPQPRGEAVMGASDQHIKSAEGSDETPISVADLDNYTVAASMPRLLEISKLGIKARILPMSVNSDNSIQAPINTNDAGWYTGSARPGGVGASFIDGHTSGATRLGLFGNLDRLEKGDEIKVERGDGQVVTYAVQKVDVVPLDKVDMTEVLAPYPGVENGLNLMTCTGDYVSKSQTSDHRVIVYTKEI